MGSILSQVLDSTERSLRRMFQLSLQRSAALERFATLAPPVQERVVSAGLRVLDTEQEVAEELGNAEWSMRVRIVFFYCGRIGIDR